MSRAAPSAFRFIPVVSMTIAIAIPILESVALHLERTQIPLALTHGLPFAVFAVATAWSRNATRPRVLARRGALASGLIVVFLVHAWGWYEKTHYRGGGVDFAFAFAYVGLGLLVGVAMVFSYALLLRARKEQAPVA